MQAGAVAEYLDLERPADNPGAERTAAGHPDSEEFLGAHRDAIVRAAERIVPHVRRTPALGTDLHSDLVLKAELLQVTGSFKVRGAFNAILSLLEREPEVPGVVAVSSGNHAQAIAHAAGACGLRSAIVIPEGSSPAKVAATRSLGAEVITSGVTMANREEIATRLAAERGFPMVHPFDDWDVIHGQATVMRELLEDAGGLDAVVVPIGGGGLISGVALAARAFGSGIRVIGAEPATADDAAQSLESGRLVRWAEAPTTIADGARALGIGARPFEVIVRRRLVDAILRVSEPEISAAMTRLWLRAHLAVEPTGALAFAAFSSDGVEVGPGARVGVILSGGNFEPAVAARILGA